MTKHNRHPQMKSTNTGKRFAALFSDMISAGDPADAIVVRGLDNAASGAYGPYNHKDLIEMAERIAGSAVAVVSQLSPTRRTVLLGDDFCITERGNTLLVHEEEHWFNAWLQLDHRRNVWLEIAFRDCNYPSLSVQTVCITDKKLATHINHEFSSGAWRVFTNNIEGVKIDTNMSRTNDNAGIAGKPTKPKRK